MEGRGLSKGNVDKQNTVWDSVPEKLCNVRLSMDKVARGLIIFGLSFLRSVITCGRSRVR